MKFHDEDDEQIIRTILYVPEPTLTPHERKKFYPPLRLVINRGKTRNIRGK